MSERAARTRRTLTIRTSIIGTSIEAVAIVTSALLGAALACTPVGRATAATAVAATDARAGPDRAVLELIGDAACDDDSQCRTLPIGAKPCGGPEYYLAWSTKRTDAAALREAAQGNLAPPITPKAVPRGNSTCIVVTDPGAYCAPADGAKGKPARMAGGSCRLRGAERGVRGRVD